MKISVTSGEHTVYIKIKGRMPEMLALAEAAALRLLAATPEPASATQPPFGFVLTTDAEPADQGQALELGGDEA